jgi:type II secretory pathway pseudopilin PulG
MINNFSLYRSKYQYDTSGGYAYSEGYDGFDSFAYKPINGTELIIIISCILSLIGVFLWGLLSTNAQNRDVQRRTDIEQVLVALDNYYLNSNTIPSNRSYPKAVCSTAANEVDFEYTLQEHLTGKRKEKDTHAYIPAESFPKDRWGAYSKTLGERKVAYRCGPLLQLETNNSNQQIYKDGVESCNFSLDRKAGRYPKCYIYTTSNNGDSFALAYYSEVSGEFFYYKKFRENTVELSRIAQ